MAFLTVSSTYCSIHNTVFVRVNHLVKQKVNSVTVDKICSNTRTHSYVEVSILYVISIVSSFIANHKAGMNHALFHSVAVQFPV